MNVTVYRGSFYHHFIILTLESVFVFDPRGCSKHKVTKINRTPLNIHFILSNIKFSSSTFAPLYSHSPHAALPQTLPGAGLSKRGFLGSVLVFTLCLCLGTEGKVGLLVSLWTTWGITCSRVLSEKGKTSSNLDVEHKKASHSPRHLTLATTVRQESCLRSDCPSLFNLISEAPLSEHWVVVLLSPKIFVLATPSKQRDGSLTTVLDSLQLTNWTLHVKPETRNAGYTSVCQRRGRYQGQYVLFCALTAVYSQIGRLRFESCFFSQVASFQISF